VRVCVGVGVCVSDCRGDGDRYRQQRFIRSERSANMSSSAGPLSWLPACPHQVTSLPVRRQAAGKTPPTEQQL